MCRMTNRGRGRASSQSLVLVACGGQRSYVPNALVDLNAKVRAPKTAECHDKVS